MRKKEILEAKMKNLAEKLKKIEQENKSKNS